MSESKRNFLFTSESVTEGHPDKIADQVSDAVLDEVMRQDPKGRVACETLVTTGLIVVAGEITTTAHVNYDEIARETVRQVGYDDARYGFDSDTCAVVCTVKRQSPDIAMGVDTGGAGDQGLMFGFACDETEELMPMPIQLSHRLTQRLSEVRKHKTVEFLRPDGKSQVTVEYRDGKPHRVDCVVISTQHSDTVSNEDLRSAIMEHVIKPIVPSRMLDAKTKYHINPTGRFVIGGPMGDAGLTGRKIIVDTYGGYSRHGGGAFSGKDPSKVDRSACYMARYIAKNIVAAGIGQPCGSAVGLRDWRCRTGLRDGRYLWHSNVVPEEKITELIRETFLTEPQGHHRSLWICASRYIRRRQLTGISAAPALALPGKKLTAPKLLRKAAGLGAGVAEAVSRR